MLLVFILTDNLGQNTGRTLHYFGIALVYLPALSALIKMQLEFSRGKVVLFTRLRLSRVS